MYVCLYMYVCVSVCIMYVCTSMYVGILTRDILPHPLKPNFS
jgi:hypothetical protein